MDESIKIAILEDQDGNLYGESDYEESRVKETEEELGYGVKSVIDIKPEGREKEVYEALLRLDSAIEGDSSIKNLLDKVLVSVWTASQEAPFKRQYGQWTLEADENGYRIYNEDEDGVKRYYLVKDGPYKNPIIEAEPDLGLDLPENGIYVDANEERLSEIPSEKITGIICKNGSEIIHRFSLSSTTRPEFTYDGDTQIITIDGEQWHLATLFSKDKNRIEGFDAYYKKSPQSAIKVIELADLDL